MKQQPHLRLFGIPKLAGYLPGYGRLLLAMVFFGTLGSVMDVVIPLFQQYAIDHFIADGAMNGLGGFLALYVLVMLVQTASNYISAYGACKAELYIGRDLKRQAFDHLQTLSFSYFNQNSVGYVHARVMSDTDRIAGTLAWGLMEGVWYIAYLLFAIVMMFVLNWKLALGVMVIVPVLAVSGVYFQKKLVVYHRQVRERNSQITGAFNEGITGAKTTKTLVIEDRMETEFDNLTGEMKRVSVREMRTRSLFMSTTALAASVALAIVLWRGGIITPSYLALVCDDVKLVVFVYLIAALSYAVVAFAQRHFVLYGRRKFVFTIVVAVTLRAILGFAYPFLPFEALILHGIGVVVPALLANQFTRQGIPLTAVSSLAVTALTVAVMNVLYFMGI